MLFIESLARGDDSFTGKHDFFLVDVYLGTFTLLDKLIESHLELHLSAHAIKEDPMLILEKLPCLVVLELSRYQGRTMFCSAKGFPDFPRLQELTLSYFSIEEWRIEGDAMSRLSRLVLFGFVNMKKLPEWLHDPGC